VTNEKNNTLKRTVFKSTADNDYDRACEKLQLNAIPYYLPCRNNERKKIQDYILNGIKNRGSSSSLYIAGMPGTGKTATTLEIIKNLKDDKKMNF
jgi:Cdc6-like AAA superfamily ATPase